MNDENNEELENLPIDQSGSGEGTIHDVIPVSGMYENWFLDYASYVILERAVPAINDGLKPVQRRILHAMKEMDDGRYNKVANIIGSTMQYHPHGDMSIGDAMVNLGQKELLIDMQGNWVTCEQVIGQLHRGILRLDHPSLHWRYSTIHRRLIGSCLMMAGKRSR